MRQVLLQMGVTLDGFADGEVRIVPEFDTSYRAELEEELARTGAASIHTILIGRGTYEEFAKYWPKAGSGPSEPTHVLDFARFLIETPKIVFSNSLTRTDWTGRRIVKGDPDEEVRRPEGLQGKNMVVAGDVRFPRTLIERDLVDEYLLTVVPMIMGKGEDRLFGEHPTPKNLKLVRSRTFGNGAVFQHYVAQR